MRRHRDPFGRARPGCAANKTITSRGRGSIFTVSNVTFVATNKGILAALVYLLV
jgi:hypothetical protein